MAKRDLKAYVRYDGQGRVVPSSVILTRRKPKVGNWVEGPAYLCCNSPTTLRPSVCQTVMTVGAYSRGGFFGYASGEGGYGTLNPNCNDVRILIWGDNTLELYTTTCYSSLIIEIDGHEYIMVLIEFTDGLYFWRLVPVDNPFPAEGETSIINLYATECTTTTTSTTAVCTAIFEVLLAAGFELAEGACASFEGDTAPCYLDVDSFTDATLLYNLADCTSPGNGYYSNGTIVRQCIDGVLGPVEYCTTTTTTTEEPATTTTTTTT